MPVALIETYTSSDDGERERKIRLRVLAAVRTEAVVTEGEREGGVSRSVVVVVVVVCQIVSTLKWRPVDEEENFTDLVIHYRIRGRGYATWL